MAHFFSARYRQNLAPLLLAVTLVTPLWVVSAQTATPAERWLVVVNGRALGYSRVLGAQPAVYLRAADLQRAVDGDLSSTRLRVEGGALVARAEGQCPKCMLRVRRAVVITQAMRSLEGEWYVPLSDLVRALEGRLVIERAQSRYAIHAGQCDWCILEPAK